MRQRIRTVLASCEAREFVDRNVAGDLIEGALNRQRDKPKHHRSLPYVDVAQFVRELESWPASLSTKLCLIFTILTGTRGIEAREARFDEIDREQRMWRIPGARMKMGEDHNQPLSEAALEVLDRARPLDDGSGYIFPSARKRGHPLTDTACMMIIRRMGYADRATVHGFRATFRTWASDCTRATERVKKLSTAHKPGDKMDAAYDRSFVLDPRRELMERWGCHVMDRPYSGPELLDLSSSGLSLQELIDFLAPALSDD